MISQQDVQAYRQQLQALRSALLTQIAEQRGGSRSRADVAADHFMHAEDSHAQVTSQRDLEFAINEHETAELADLELALLRLDAGTYGVCIDCAAPIPEARLKARPEAQRCMACQEKIEHTHL
ncbi:MAG: TraR/DksA family transcriptional regulator [Polaromonas sp.]|nr:TraR/DksA family transcriptional regulator [Polaromonas sp.]